MARLKDMHAPGSECAHLMEPAGVKTQYQDVFRYNRVTSHNPPDPCIRPNEADLICKPDDPPPTRNHPNMPTAGFDGRISDEEFSFHKVRPSRIKNPCKSESGAISLKKPCPCSNRQRYPPSKPVGIRDPQMPGLAISPNVHNICHSDYEALPPLVESSSSRGGPDEMQRPRNPDLRERRPDSSEPYFCMADAPDHQIGSAYESHSNPELCGYPIELQGYSQECLPQMRHKNMLSVKRPHCPDLAVSPKTKQDDAPDTSVVVGDLTYGNNYVTKAQIPQRDACDAAGLLQNPNPLCSNPYYHAPYRCRPVYNRKYLEDCPEQDGPPADSYTFL